MTTESSFGARIPSGISGEMQAAITDLIQCYLNAGSSARKTGYVDGTVSLGELVLFNQCAVERAFVEAFIEKAPGIMPPSLGADTVLGTARDLGLCVDPPEWVITMVGIPVKGSASDQSTEPHINEWFLTMIHESADPPQSTVPDQDIAV